MKPFALITFLYALLLTNFAHTQKLDWIKYNEGSNYDGGMTVEIDNLGFLYTVGNFSGTVDFDPNQGEFNLDAVNYTDIFIQKLSNEGDLIYVKHFGGSGFGNANSINIDQYGNIFITGFFSGTIDFDPGSNINNLTSIEDQDIFILKLNSNGNLAWVSQFGGSGTGAGLAVETDIMGNIYIGCSISGTIDFDPGPNEFNMSSSFESLELIISKLDQSGNLLWAKKTGGKKYGIGNFMKVDPYGNIYTTGAFEEITDFDPGVDTFNLVSHGSTDIYIQKLDTDGKLQWVKQIGGNRADEGHSIDIDQQGDIYTVGCFITYPNEVVDFNPDQGVYNLASNGLYDIYIHKLDALGNFIWAKQIGGSNDDIGQSISINKQNEIYITGYVFNSVDYNIDSSPNILPSFGKYDVFILKLDALGNSIWAKQFGENWSDSGNCIIADGEGNIFSIGIYKGNNLQDYDFGPFYLGTQSSSAVMLHKFDNFGTLSWAKLLGKTHQCGGGSIVTDSNGDIISSGIFSGIVDFDPGPGITYLSSNSQGNGFIQKLDKEGNLKWVNNFGSDYGSISIKEIAKFQNGSIYAVGQFSGTVDFDPGPNVFNLSTMGDFKTDAFILKLDSTGRFIWVKQLQGEYHKTGLSIDLDQLGNSYIIGGFVGTVDFDPGIETFNQTSNGFVDLYILKLDINGIFVWAKQIGGESFDDGLAITVDQLGNSYITGGFGETVDFNPNTGNCFLTADGNSDAFILKLNSNGIFMWVKQLRGEGIIYGKTLNIDKNENIIISGGFSQLVDFDPGPAEYNLSPNGLSDNYILKLNKNGDLQWVKSFGSSTSVDIVNSTIIDIFENIYTLGSFKSTVDFDPGPNEFNLVSNGKSDIYIQKLDRNGNFLWVRRLGDAIIDFGGDLAIDNYGNIYAIGSYRGNLYHDTILPNLSDFLAHSNSFVLKMSPCDYPAVPILSVSENIICHGDSVTISVENPNELNDSEYWSLYQESCGQITIDSNSFGEFTVRPSATSKYFVRGEGGCVTDGDCGSIQIEVFPDYLLTENIEICEGDDFTFPDGTSLTNITGNVIHTSSLSTINGCDSNIISNIQAVPTYSFFENIIICNGDSYTFHDGTTLSNITGQVVHTANLSTMNGCDSIITTTVDVLEIDISVLQSGPVLSSNSTSGSYQWLDCNNGFTPIIGETSQSFNAYYSGNYAVEIIVGGCIDTSECSSIIGTTTIDWNKSKIRLFPNPVANFLTLDFTQTDISKCSIAISDINGKTIIQTKKKINEKLIKIDVEQLVSGFYFLKVQMNDKYIYRKIVIQ